MDEAINQLLAVLEDMIQSGEEIPDELQGEIAGILNDYAQSLSAPSAPSVQPQVSDPATLLWILAGGKHDAFVNYLRTYPDPQLNELLRNPSQLELVINELERIHPMEALTNDHADGIQHADLNSSNVYGYQYDPKSKKLLVRFNSGSVYGYDGVPPGIFKVFADGAVPAKTTGQNQHGKWWQGKLPSLGASFYEMIRKGGFPYQKLK